MTLTRESLEAARLFDEVERMAAKFDDLLGRKNEGLATTLKFARAGLHTNARIAELEAENARLRAGLDKIEHFPGPHPASTMHTADAWKGVWTAIREVARQALKGTTP